MQVRAFTAVSLVSTLVATVTLIGAWSLGSELARAAGTTNARTSFRAPGDAGPAPANPNLPQPTPRQVERPPTDAQMQSTLNDLAVRDLAKRLSALSPSKPMEYFLLGEEVASEARTRSDRKLARELFVLAMHLDQQAGSPESITPSALLSLASLSPSDRERHYLNAAARVAQTGPRSAAAQPAKRRLAILQPTDQTGFDLATALGLSRVGEGRRSDILLDRPEVAALLVAYEPVINSDGEINALQTIRSWNQTWATCPECRNRRTITRSDGPGTPARVRLCRTCNGQPGPDLTLNQLLGQLRAESVLLRGVHRFWSSQALVDEGQPLRDPTPEAVAESLQVDVSRAYFRDGAWVEKP
ncbi:MAG: hypothetical protein IBJ18_00370 [Phycisphaerales bacterium]|nr:hypothetical protein [Phycisphaerales bacterium]